MAKFRNTSSKNIIVGAIKVYPNSIIETSEETAAKFPELQPVGVPSQELLTEAPVGEAEVVTAKKKKRKRKVDVNEDNASDA